MPTSQEKDWDRVRKAAGRQRAAERRDERELTWDDDDDMRMWKERTEGMGIIGSAVHSMAIWGSLTPPVSEDGRPEREFGDYSGREVREFGGNRTFLDRFKL